MRITLTVALALVALAALYQGCRSLWRFYRPDDAGEGAATPPGERRLPSGTWLLLLSLLLLLALGIEHVLEVPEQPPRHYDPPHMENGQIVPGRFY
ncbi:MAG: hypothetical protein HQL66_03730 [Magnetococcales bacterium]|nr:hypothetical protein [Magnetococcales bacterium]